MAVRSPICSMLVLRWLPDIQVSMSGRKLYSTEFNEEIQARGTHLVDGSTCKVFKSMRLDKTIKGVSIKEKKRSKD